MIRFELNKGGKRMNLAPALQKLEKILSKEFKKNGVISIAIIDSGKSKELNKRYRKKNKPADVLTFVFGGKNLGEILISYNEAKKRAKDSRKTISKATLFLIVHGVCHIMGYGHKIDKDAERMEIKEKKILSKLDVRY